SRRGMQVGVEIDVHGRIEAADGGLARRRDIAVGVDGRLIEDGGERPSRRGLRHRRQASERAREPQANAAFIGARRVGGESSDRGGYERGRSQTQRQTTTNTHSPPLLRYQYTHG